MFNWIHNPLQRPVAQGHQVGDIVSFTEPGSAGRLGKVQEVFDAHRNYSNRFGPQPEHLLYHVRYYDLNTGLPLVCPDSRCRGQHSCPIHGRNVRREQIAPLSARDLAYYRAQGIILD